MDMFPVMKDDITKYIKTTQQMSRLKIQGDSNYRLGDTQIQILNLAMDTYLPRLMRRSIRTNPQLVHSILRVTQKKPGLICFLPRRVGKSTVFGHFCATVISNYDNEKHQIFAMKVDQAAIVVDFATNLSKDKQGNLPPNYRSTQSELAVNHKEGVSFVKANTSGDVS